MNSSAARLDMVSVRAGLAARAAEVAVGLLGEPNGAMSSGRELRFGRHGSLAVVIAGPKAGVWRDHETGVGGDLLDLIVRERGGSFREAIEYAERFIGQAPLDPAPAPRRRERPALGDQDRNSERALAIWDDAEPITSTIAEGYLATRGVAGVIADDGEVLRFHGSCPYADTRRPCMVALLRNIHTNEPKAIQRTALTADGEKIGRMTLGPKNGCAVKLSDDADVDTRLTIGEGVETVLAAMKLGYAPAWAVGDAGELGKFPVLNAIGSITLLVDNDSTGAGQRAASECSARWTAAGREIFYLVPDATGADVNDLIRSGPAGSEGSRTVGRPNPPALHVEKEPNDAVLF